MSMLSKSQGSISVDKLHWQASRGVFNEINAKFPALPFTFRELETEKARSHRMGIKECLNHGLLHPYPVLYEKSGELVAQFKATVLLMPNGSDRCVIDDMRQENFLFAEITASSCGSYSSVS